ncbi:MAG TPA: ABC transporter permease subunit [Devosia sp.]|nr:ABC transporter permease subunit [Devosia sp.]
MRNSGILRDWRLLIGIVPALAFLAIFLVYPVSQMLVLGFQTADGGFTLAQFGRLFESSVYVRVLLNSVQVAAYTSIFCIIVGYPVAYMLSIAQARSRAFLLIWVLLPLWTSFLVRAVAWILLLGDQGILNAALQGLGVTGAPIKLIGTFSGVLIGTIHAMVPVAVMMMLSVMSGIDRRLTLAASTLGARGPQSFWRIYFPLSAPGVVAAALIVFVNSLGFFVASQLLGGIRDIMISQLIIQQVEQVFDLNFAGALSVVLLIATLLVIFVFSKVLGLSALTGEYRSPGGRKQNFAGLMRNVGLAATNGLGSACTAIIERFDGLRPPRVSSGGIPIRLRLVVGVVLVFIATPTLVLLPASFSQSQYLTWPPRGFTTEWYSVFLATPLWGQALLRSLLIGICAASLAMVIGIPAAYVLGKRQFAGKSYVLTAILIPVVLPSIIIGVGLFYMYSHLGLLQTTLGLVLGHTVFALPYVIIAMLAALRSYDDRLDQAAWTLGASKLTAFRTISLPLMKTGIGAAFLFGFVQSFDELSVALFVASPTNPTLPRQLWTEALYKLSPTLAAASVVMVLIVAIPIILSQMRIGSRSRR